jgi:hypothetical protein
MAAVSADGVLVARQESELSRLLSIGMADMGDGPATACERLVSICLQTLYAPHAVRYWHAFVHLFCDFDQLLCSRINFGCITRAVWQTLSSCNL